jgi:hypothetical protein
VPRIFISHSSHDRQLADDLAELFRIHYIETWYSKRDILAGPWEPEIYKGLDQCDSFLVILSDDALQSQWVRKEVELAMQDSRYLRSGRIVPLLARSCTWPTIHPGIDRFQLVDFTRDRDEAIARLLRYWQIDRYVFRQAQVGDVLMPVYRFLGGDGTTRFNHPDGIVANVPDGTFLLPAEIAAMKSVWLERHRAEAAKRNAIFVNNPMIRLNQFAWDQQGPTEVIARLRLDVSRTDYFDMQVTNSSMDEVLPDGERLERRFGGAIDDLAESQLANPLATNLSIVTADGMIFVSQRSMRVAWNPGGYGPAVSGTGNPLLDCRSDGSYDAFLTARREAFEEATSPLTPEPSQITFFGLARTFKARFPFLFGELRLPVTSSQLLSQVPTQSWESRGLIAIPFTIDAVTEWIVARYRDQIGQRGLSAAVGTTFFSLLQSLLYEYPDRWQQVIRAMTFSKRASTNAS